MPDGMTVDFGEVDQLAASIGEVPDATGPFIRTAFEVTSGNVKEAANKSVRNDNESGRWDALPGSIDYDISLFEGFGASVIKSEIGYNEERFGERAELGNLREYGAPGADGVPLAPHDDLRRALHDNEKDFVTGLSNAMADGMKAAGL